MTELTDFFIVRYGRLTFSCYVNSLAQLDTSQVTRIQATQDWSNALGRKGRHLTFRASLIGPQ